MRTLADPEAVRAVLLGDRARQQQGDKGGGAGGGTADDVKRGEDLLKRVTEQAVFKVWIWVWTRCVGYVWNVEEGWIKLHIRLHLAYRIP